MHSIKWCEQSFTSSLTWVNAIPVSLETTSRACADTRPSCQTPWSFMLTREDVVFKHVLQLSTCSRPNRPHIAAAAPAFINLAEARGRLGCSLCVSRQMWLTWTWRMDLQALTCLPFISVVSHNLSHSLNRTGSILMQGLLAELMMVQLF